MYARPGARSVLMLTSLWMHLQDLEKQNMTLTNRFLTLLEGLRGRLESLEDGANRLEEHCQAINQR